MRHGPTWASPGHWRRLHPRLNFLRFRLNFLRFEADEGSEETGNALDARLIRARAECLEIPETLFSPLERRCFHFS